MDAGLEYSLSPAREMASGQLGKISRNVQEMAENLYLIRSGMSDGGGVVGDGRKRSDAHPDHQHGRHWTLAEDAPALRHDSEHKRFIADSGIGSEVQSVGLPKAVGTTRSGEATRLGEGRVILSPLKRSVQIDEEEGVEEEVDVNSDASGLTEYSMDENSNMSDISDTCVQDWDAAGWYGRVTGLFEQLQSNQEWDMMFSLRKAFDTRAAARIQDLSQIEALNEERTVDTERWKNSATRFGKGIEDAQVHMFASLSSFNTALHSATDLSRQNLAKKKKKAASRFTFSDMKTDRKVNWNLEDLDKDVAEVVEEPKRQETQATGLLRLISGQQSQIAGLQTSNRFLEMKVASHQAIVAHLEKFQEGIADAEVPEAVANMLCELIMKRAGLGTSMTSGTDADEVGVGPSETGMGETAVHKANRALQADVNRLKAKAMELQVGMDGLLVGQGKTLPPNQDVPSDVAHPVPGTSVAVPVGNTRTAFPPSPGAVGPRITRAQMMRKQQEESKHSTFHSTASMEERISKTQLKISQAQLWIKRAEGERKQFYDSIASAEKWRAASAALPVSLDPEDGQQFDLSTEREGVSRAPSPMGAVSTPEDGLRASEDPNSYSVREALGSLLVLSRPTSSSRAASASMQPPSGVGRAKLFTHSTGKSPAQTLENQKQEFRNLGVALSQTLCRPPPATLEEGQEILTALEKEEDELLLRLSERRRSNGDKGVQLLLERGCASAGRSARDGKEAGARVMRGSPAPGGSRLRRRAGVEGEPVHAPSPTPGAAASTAAVGGTNAAKVGLSKQRNARRLFGTNSPQRTQLCESPLPEAVACVAEEGAGVADAHGGNTIVDASDLAAAGGKVAGGVVGLVATAPDGSRSDSTDKHSSGGGVGASTALGSCSTVGDPTDRVASVGGNGAAAHTSNQRGRIRTQRVHFGSGQLPEEEKDGAAQVAPRSGQEDFDDSHGEGSPKHSQDVAEAKRSSGKTKDSFIRATLKERVSRQSGHALLVQTRCSTATSDTLGFQGPPDLISRLLEVQRENMQLQMQIQSYKDKDKKARAQGTLGEQDIRELRSVHILEDQAAMEEQQVMVSDIKSKIKRLQRMLKQRRQEWADSLNKKSFLSALLSNAEGEKLVDARSSLLRLAARAKAAVAAAGACGGAVDGGAEDCRRESKEASQGVSRHVRVLEGEPECIQLNVHAREHPGGLLRRGSVALGRVSMATVRSQEFGDLDAHMSSPISHVSPSNCTPTNIFSRVRRSILVPLAGPAAGAVEGVADLGIAGAPALVAAGGARGLALRIPQDAEAPSLDKRPVRHVQLVAEDHKPNGHSIPQQGGSGGLEGLEGHCLLTSGITNAQQHVRSSRLAQGLRFRYRGLEVTGKFSEEDPWITSIAHGRASGRLRKPFEVHGVRAKGSPDNSTFSTTSAAKDASEEKACAPHDSYRRSQIHKYLKQMSSGGLAPHERKKTSIKTLARSSLLMEGTGAQSTPAALAEQGAA